MKTITFIPSDYDDLTSPNVPTDEQSCGVGVRQFASCHDCPFARAAKRQNIPWNTAAENWRDINHLKYSNQPIDLIRQRLLAGEPSVTVELYDNNTYKIL